MDYKPLDILLAEDNEDDILMTREAFEKANVVNIMHVVKDGEEVMTYLRKQGPYKDVPMPGLLLLDIGMPKRDGLQVLKEIKADPNLQHLPVVMLTTSSREEDILKSFKAGACSYISKPIAFRNFHEVVKAFKLYWTLVSKVPNGNS
jgi:CheY-like chemotaxis protein